MKKIAIPMMVLLLVGVSPAWAWVLGTLVDEYGDATTKKYIQTEAIGTFSNSATRDSFLKVEVIVDQENHVGVFLHEYSPDRSPVYFTGSGVMMAKNSTGKTFKTQSIGRWSQTGGISLINDRSAFISFLRNSNSEIKVVVHDEYSSTYNFTISAYGFATEYDKMKPQPQNKPKTN